MPTETSRMVADRYELLDSLGRGGMGVVWCGRDTILQRDVAIKEVEFPGGLDGEERRAMEARVMREARAAARLNHPNVVVVFDVVEDEGRTFIVMELVESPTLAEIVEKEGPLSPERAAEVGLGVLAAIQAAHAEGIVHRDVKPGNVMITGKNVKLGDFGIASVKDDPKITSTGLILGSPSYMAPEQATHGKSGPGSDLWALGATLYYAIEGAPPFDKGQAIPTLAAVVGDRPRPMQNDAGALLSIIDELLNKESTDRPSPDEIRRRLEAVVAGNASPTQASTARIAEPTREETRAQTAPASIDLRTPPAMPEPEVDKPRSAPSRGVSGWLIAIGVLLLIGIAALLIVPNLGEEEAPDAASGKKDRPAAAANEPKAEEDAGAAEEAPASAPEDWTEYSDESIGYSIAYPTGWQIVEQDANAIDFRDPESGAYMRVDWVTPPTGDDPAAVWEASEENFAARYPDYERIDITSTTFKNMEAGAWEYTYSDGGAQLRAVNLGFITEDGEYGMALNFQTPAEDWESSQPIFEAFQESFQAP